MKLQDIVGRVTQSGTGQYDAHHITGWINEIEGQILDEVVNRAKGYELEFHPLDYDTCQDYELIVPERFQDVYLYYVAAKIDHSNQETERYNNDVAMFNAAYESYAAWFRRHHRQKSRIYFSRF